MRLSALYQPKTLSDIVGQPAVVRRLQRIVAAPSPCCLLLEGKGGTGKSATAKALIHDLEVDELYGVHEYSGANFKIEDVRRLFGQAFRFRPMGSVAWTVLLIEELEFAASREVNSALKDNLSEQNMPPHLIVIATSNDASGLDEALLQRFDVFPFSCGPTFAEACQERLAAIWAQLAGQDVPMPLGVDMMGWRGESYSMRRAMSALGAAIELQRQATGRAVPA